MKSIKNFTKFNSINEEFVPKKITKESRNQALLELSRTLDSNKKDLLSLLLLSVAAFYSSADQLQTLKRYKDETGTNLFPTTATEVRDVYNRLTRGFDVDQFQLLTVVLSVFAVDLGIDSNTIGFNARVAGQSIGKENGPISGYEPEAVKTGGGAEMRKESLKTSKVFNRILESINFN